MVKRWIVMVGLVVLLFATYVFVGTPQGAVTASNGRAVPVNDAGTMFMVTLDLDNAGGPVALRSVSSPSGAAASFMNPGHDGDMVVPGSGSAQLAMDGAHIMLRVPAGEFPQGAFQSLSLTLDDGSDVVARILHSDAANGMDHGAANGVTTAPAPSIALAADPRVSAEGFSVSIHVENFDFTRVEDGAPHVDGQGHAHLYLNGVKLGRLYAPEFRIGALSPGDYVLSVGLNTNDHRPYLSTDGSPVTLTYAFSL